MFLLTIIFVSNSFYIIAQDSSKFIKRSELINENFIINTDRDIYICGDDLFYHIDYFVNGIQLQNDFSTVVYLELIEIKTNKAVIQKKLGVKNNRTSGFFQLPSDINSGNYILRCYTQYQRNFSSLGFSYVFITILNPEKNELLLTKNINNDSIFIVPESNILLDGIENNIVIKTPLTFRNAVVDYAILNADSTIYLKPPMDEYGLISTNVLPDIENPFMFRIILKDDTIIKDFPKIFANGIQGNININEDHLFYNLTNTMKNISGQYKLKIFSNNLREIYSEKLYFKNIYSINKIDNNLLFKGINYIALYKNNQLIKIRSIYKNNSKNYYLNITTETDEFNRRDTISASFSIDEDDDTLVYPTSYTISVLRTGTKVEHYNVDPINYLYNPILLDGYLSNNDLNYCTVNDLMILFNQLCNFESDEFKIFNSLSQDTIEVIPELNGLSISGILLDKKTGERIPKQNIYLSVLNGRPELHIAKTRDNGKFLFSLNNLYGEKHIYLGSEAFNNMDSTHIIKVKNPYSSNIPAFEYNLPPVFNDKQNDLFNELYINNQVTKKFKERKQQPNNIITDSLFNINDLEIEISPKDYIEFQSIKDFINEVVPNVILKENKDKIDLKILDKNYNVLSANPLIIIDYIPLFNTDEILKIKPDNLKSIKINYKPYYLGNKIFMGIIVFDTKSGDFGGINYSNSTIFIDYIALDYTNYRPSFDTTQLNSSKRIPDFRTTLYWDPVLKSNNKVQNFEFISSDRKGKYNIEIIGYNKYGRKYYGKKAILIK